MTSESKYTARHDLNSLAYVLAWSRQEVARAAHLLEARGIRRMLAVSPAPLPDKEFLWNELVQLQCAVYRLDKLGEQQWNIKASALQHRWTEIEKVAFRFQRSEGLKTGLSEIREYQSLELALRDGRSVTATDIWTFYRAKTCDIRLIRNLVASDGWTDVPPAQIRSAWNLVDMIGEVVDDVMDLTEDGFTFNGNRFLASLRETGSAWTTEEYCEFLEDLGRRCRSEESNFGGFPGPDGFSFKKAVALAAETVRQVRALDRDDLASAFFAPTGYCLATARLT